MEKTPSQLRHTLNLIKEKNATPQIVTLDGRHLTTAVLKRIATDSGIKVQLSEEAIKDMDNNFAYLTNLIEQNHDVYIYGLNTGFGGSSNVRAKSSSEIQDALLRLLNIGFGKTFPPDLVRSAMVARANSLSMAYSGVSSSFVQLLVDIINNNIVPAVPLRGSISASGDLIPLSYVAATLIGRADLKVFHNGEEKLCQSALDEASITPVKMQRREGLAIANGTSFTVGVAAPLLYDVNIVCLLTQICTALAVEGLNGTTESFNPLIHASLPHYGQQEVASNLRKLLQDSELADQMLDITKRESLSTKRLKQDRYSLRSAPQWLGPVVESLNEANRRFAIELNGISDNPLIDHRSETVLNGANFQGETLSLTLDQMRQNIGVCGKILFAQFSELVNDDLNFGLPPNLSGCDFHTDFGYKGADIAMAAYMSELDHLVNPMSNHVVSAELHNQSINSLALISYRMTAEALEILQMMVANHLNMVVQAVDLRYLQYQVNATLQKFKADINTHSIFRSHRHWYEFVFCQEQIIEEVLATNETKLTPDVEKAMHELNKIYDEIKDGRCNIAASLGQGTRKVYTFIRETLGIPFNYGQSVMDGWLQTIFSAIQEVKMDVVLVNIFTAHEDQSH